jgi:DNA polymerase III epsilon subunit-like protein
MLSKNKILVLDTETTGLVNFPIEESTYFESLSATKSKIEKEDPKYLKHKPKILQLSYIVYDLDNPESAKIYDKYILPTQSLIDSITPGAAKVHGITSESLKKKPKTMFTTIQDAIDELKKDVESCDVFVGHNINFDIERIREEVQRTTSVFSFTNKVYKALLDEIESKKYDTMKGTKETCKIPGKKPGSIKNPKLSEAYKYFFQDEANEEALHNALVDIIVCLRVYVKHVYSRDICGENEEITRWIEFLSSIPGYKCYKKEDSIKQVHPVVLSSKTKGKSKSVWSCIGSICGSFTRRKNKKKIVPMGGRKTRKYKHPLIKK